MIAVDTSSLIAFLEGMRGEDVDLLDEALKSNQVTLPPVVLTELLSDPALPKNVVQLFKSLPILEITDGYWERTGAMRAKLLSKGRRAKVGDALIAQACLDHEVGLLTRDEDFAGFASVCGLVLVS